MRGSVLVRAPQGVKVVQDMRLNRDEHMSEWMKDCFKGNLDKIKEHLEKEPRLLDRRESLLRMNGLMHVIEGFKQSESICLEVWQKAGNEDMEFISEDHMDSLRYLLEKGTPVDCKDFLGHTPLHRCIGAFGTKGLCKLAKCLLDKGANINIENRFGFSPLIEPSFALNMDCVNWLLENGADLFKAKRHGQSLYEASRNIPSLRDSVDRYISEFAKQEKQEASKEGTYRSCAVCKKKTQQRCAGCFLSWYCSKECQVSGWENHIKECKEKRREYVSFKLVQGNFSTLISRKGDSKISTFNATGGMPSGRSHFVVKIQSAEGSLLVYNEKKTICGTITPEMPHYREVREQIRENGFAGRKAYFYAKWNWKEGEGLKINVKRVQPTETW